MEQPGHTRTLPKQHLNTTKTAPKQTETPWNAPEQALTAKPLYYNKLTFKRCSTTWNTQSAYRPQYQHNKKRLSPSTGTAA
jgi:hypothetical protein